MKLRIFVIDDEESVRDAFKWYLEELGHEVVTAADPSLCHAFQGHHCDNQRACGDVFLVDHNMHTMTGLELFERMATRGCKGRADNKYLITGNIHTVDMDKVVALGCHIQEKPMRFSLLKQLIDEAGERIDPERKLVELEALEQTYISGSA